MEGKLSHRPYQFRSERLCDRDFHAEMLSGEAVWLVPFAARLPLRILKLEQDFDWFCIKGSVNSCRARTIRRSNDKTKIPLFRKKMFPKKLFEGRRRRRWKGKFSESSLWNTWRRTQNELEGRKEEEEMEVLVGVGGDNHFYFVIQCMEEGCRGRDHCSSAPSMLWEHFDRQSNTVKGTLLLAGSEEAVYRGACLIWSPDRPLVWKRLVLWCLSLSPVSLLFLFPP